MKRIKFVCFILYYFSVVLRGWRFVGHPSSLLLQFLCVCVLVGERCDMHLGRAVRPSVCGRLSRQTHNGLVIDFLV